MNKNDAAPSAVSAFSAREGRRHFHTFDALRFFAFLKVFLLHLPIVAFPWFNFLRAGGGIGVQFFFVLSGFLITYIIAEEKLRKGQMDLKKFFARRALRIWPLYYLMVLVAYSTPWLLGLLQLPPGTGEGYEPELWMSLLFLENYKMMMAQDFANVSPLTVMWSLCIEEHFYIAWGLLLGFLRMRYLPVVFVLAILIGPLCRLVYVGYGVPTSDLPTNIDLFAWGALPAWLWLTQRDRVEGLLHRVPFGYKQVFVVFVLVAVLVCSQLKGDRAFILPTSLLGCLFALLITLILPERNRMKISGANWLSLAGVYTYGLYLYHTLVISLLRQVFASRGWGLDRPLYAIAFVAAALALSLTVSWLSYRLFEKPFLKLKRYFR